MLCNLHATWTGHKINYMYIIISACGEPHISHQPLQTNICIYLQQPSFSNVKALGSRPLSTETNSPWPWIPHGTCLSDGSSLKSSATATLTLSQTARQSPKGHLVHYKAQSPGQGVCCLIVNRLTSWGGVGGRDEHHCKYIYIYIYHCIYLYGYITVYISDIFV